MAKTKMFKFNIKNVKFSIKDPETGTWGEFQDLAYANSLSLEADYNELVLYGDGQKLAVLPDDKGKTGVLSVTNIEKAYEIACGRMMEIDGGIAKVQQLKAVEHTLYYEVDAIENDERLTIKSVLYGCITGKPNETFNQTADDPTVNTYDYPLTNLGVELRAATGEDLYKDDKGNTIRVTEKVVYPGDPDYETFGIGAPTMPKAKVVTP